MKFEDCKQAFHFDGSWRDIYVFDTTIDDWEKFLDFVRNYDCKLRLLHDGDPSAIPDTALKIFQDTEHSHSLSMDIDDITIVAHFFRTDEIEMDIDPREITSQIQFDRFTNFVLALGSKLQKDIFITEENASEEIWFRYSFDKQKLEFQLAPWVTKEVMS